MNKIADYQNLRCRTKFSHIFRPQGIEHDYARSDLQPDPSVEFRKAGPFGVKFIPTGTMHVYEDVGSC